MKDRYKNIAVVTIFNFIVLAPWVFHFFGFSTPKVIGNTKVVNFPEGEELYPSNIGQTVRAVSDRVPIRKEVISLRSKFYYNLAGVLSPLPVGLISKDVVYGDDGWLFYTGQYNDNCNNLSNPDLKNAVEAFTNIFKHRYKNFYIIPSPDKSSLYRDKQSYLLNSADCHARKKKRRKHLIRNFKAGFSDNFLNTWSFLKSLKVKHDKPLYSKGDTHWNSFTQSKIIKFIVNRISPNLFKNSDILINTTDNQLQGLFNSFLILDKKIKTNEYKIIRPKIKTSFQNMFFGDVPGERYISQSLVNGENLILGKTIFIHDSFFNKMRAGPELAKYFSDITYIHYDNLKPDKYFKDGLYAADRVIFQSIERSLWIRVNRLLSIEKFI